MEKTILILLFAIFSTNLSAQECIERFVENMIAVHSEKDAALSAELHKHWPTTYTKNVNNKITYNIVPKYSDTLRCINIGVVLGSPMGMKIDKGKGLLPKHDYLCYYDCNNIVFGESLIFYGKTIIGHVNKLQFKRKCIYDYSDAETIATDTIYNILIEVQPDIAFRLSGQGNLIVYYIKDKRLMAICPTILTGNQSIEQYEILTYEECYEKYLKLPIFYFWNK